MQRLRAEVPAGLATVIERMMAKSPADRFATPAEVAAAMAPFAAGCDLVRVSAEAAATAGGAVARTKSPSATEPSAASAVVDTDPAGLPAKVKAGESTPAPKPEFSDLRRMKFQFGNPPGLWIAVGGAVLFAVVLLGVLVIELEPVRERS